MKEVLNKNIYVNINKSCDLLDIKENRTKGQQVSSSPNFIKQILQNKEFDKQYNTDVLLRGVLGK